MTPHTQAPCPACKNKGKQVSVFQTPVDSQGSHPCQVRKTTARRSTCLHTNMTIKSCPKLLPCASIWA